MREGESLQNSHKFSKVYTYFSTFKQHGVRPQFRINILGVLFTCICIDMYRHTSSRVQGVGVRSNVTKREPPGEAGSCSMIRFPLINKFIPLFLNSKKTKCISTFSIYQFLLFPMSLLSCSLFKIAYSHVPQNLLVGLRKVRRLISRTYMYIGCYSTGAGSSLA